MLPNLLNEGIDFITTKFAQVNLMDPNIYRNFLVQSYFYVRHSTKLLSLAVSRFDWSEDSLRFRFERHIGEESRHEKLIIMDLKNMGSRDSHVWQEEPATKALYQVQYYNINYTDPICLLGYILFLETLAVRVGGPLLQQLEPWYGSNCVSFLRIHSREDIEHLEEAVKLLEGLDPIKHCKVEEAFFQTVYLYEKFLQSLNEKFPIERKSLEL